MTPEERATLVMDTMTGFVDDDHISSANAAVIIAAIRHAENDVLEKVATAVDKERTGLEDSTSIKPETQILIDLADGIARDIRAFKSEERDA